MTGTSIQQKPIFRVQAEIIVRADPSDVYSVVSDLPRSGEWSPECQGGAWVHGEPATVGAVFRGENLRGTQVVAWAPVVRGNWTTESEVVVAEPGRSFRWAMRDSRGRRQDSVWGFDLEPAGGHTRLIHHFRMGVATEGIRGITADMSDAEKKTFFDDWAEKLEGDLPVTLARIKSVIDSH